MWAINVNERALELVRKNASDLGVSNTVACLPDEVPSDLRWSGIYSNPPVRIGKTALHNLLAKWLDHLLPEGRAFLVVQKHLGSDSLARWLNEQGYPTRQICSKNAYRILEIHSPHSR